MHQKQLAVALFATMAALMTAVDAEAQGPAFAYAIASPMAVYGLGDRSAAFDFGGGAEGWIGRNLTAGVELDDVYFPGEERSARYTYYSRPAVNAILLSGSLSRYFARQHATSKFITGGLSIIGVRDAATILFNLGGGLEHRLTRRTALRLEHAQKHDRKCHP